MPLEISRSDEFAGRKLGRHHLAFYRAWLQGIDLKDAAERYLETGFDLRAARTTLEWIRTSLAMAARRQGRHADVRLLRLPLHFLRLAGEAVKRPQLPTLEAFREQHDPGGVYTEQELTDLYLETYPEAQDARAVKVARLIDRQLAALAWVEDLLVTAPHPADPVGAWFEAPLAARLILADIRTVDDLRRRAGERYRWWVAVPRLGEQGAQRLVRWLSSHGATLGPLAPPGRAPLRTLPAQALARPAATALLPLESFQLPADLDGRQGTNRLGEGRCRIEAGNDYAAVLAWLQLHTNPNTQRTYRREAERLMLWAVLERGRAFSSLTIEDLTDYFAWLKALGRSEPAAWPWRVPQAAWLAPRHTPRWSTAWAPFEGAVTLASRRQAHRVLKALIEWLTRVRYLDTNPLEAVPAPRARIGDGGSAPAMEASHALSRAQMAYLVKHLDGLPAGEAPARLRFILLFAYATGMRRAELVDARFGRLYTMPLKTAPGVRWMLKVLGKGGRWRAVPLPQAVMAALRDYLAARSLNADPTKQPDDAPLIARLGGHNESPLSASMLHAIVTGFFKDAARELEGLGHPEEAQTLAQASTHWLRHTRGSHSAETMPLPMVQALLGHASLTTTTLYTSPDEEQLYLQLDRALGAAPQEIPFKIMAREV